MSILIVDTMLGRKRVNNILYNVCLNERCQWRLKYSENLRKNLCKNVYMFCHLYQKYISKSSSLFLFAKKPKYDMRSYKLYFRLPRVMNVSKQHFRNGQDVTQS